MPKPFKSDMMNLLVYVLSGVGALNWGTREFLNTDLLTDVLSLGTDAQTVVFLAVGLAGAALLASLAMGGRIDQGVN